MPIDLTLDRIRILSSYFERFSRPTIHVAGTNGKGSVSAFLTQICVAADLSVGQFNSPHLVSVHDSVRLNGDPVSKQLFDSVFSEVKTVNEKQNTSASSFETLAMTALLILERAQVDIVICEVGMGGRLDATNVIPDDCILLSVITSIDLDHQAFLGSTVSEIAHEKAGIIRSGRPVVLSAQKYDEVRNVVDKVAQAMKAPLYLASIATGRAWDERIDGPRPVSSSLSPFQPPAPRPVDVRFSEKTYSVSLPLYGDHQLINVGTAISAFNILATTHPGESSLASQRLSKLSPEKLSSAVRSCAWPGRLSFHTYQPYGEASRSLTILADGAHNEAASHMLASYIENLLSSIQIADTEELSLCYVLALSHSPPKTPASVLAPLLTIGKTGTLNRMKKNIAFVRFSPPEGMPWVTSVAPSIMAELVRSEIEGGEVGNAGEKGACEVWTAPDDETDNKQDQLKLALQWALKQSEKGNKKSKSLVLVAGSLYLVADLYRLLGY